MIELEDIAKEVEDAADRVGALEDRIVEEANADYASINVSSDKTAVHLFWLDDE